MEILPFVEKHRIFTSVSAPDPKVIHTIVKMVMDGGLRLVEIGLANKDALDIIATYASNEEVMIGAGGVFDKIAMQQAIGAGARFIVCTHVDPEIIKGCKEKKVMVISTAVTPTEVALAHRFGANIIRVFPAEAMGGAAYLQVLGSANPRLRLLAAGGVSRENVMSYFQAGATAVEIPHPLLGTEALRKGEWPKLALAAQKFLDRLQVE